MPEVIDGGEDWVVETNPDLPTVKPKGPVDPEFDQLEDAGVVIEYGLKRTEEGERVVPKRFIFPKDTFPRDAIENTGIARGTCPKCKKGFRAATVKRSGDDATTRQTATGETSENGPLAAALAGVALVGWAWWLQRQKRQNQ